MRSLSYFISGFGTFGTLLFLSITSWFLTNDKDRDLSFGKSLVKKFLRLYPEYILSILILFVGSRFLPLGERAVSLKTFLWNLSMLEGFIDSIRYVDGAHWYITTLIAVSFWTLLIERQEPNKREICYILIVILGFLCNRWNFIEWLYPFIAADYIGIVVFVIEIKRIIYNVNKGSRWMHWFCILVSVIHILEVYGSGHVVIVLMALFILTLCEKKHLHFLENSFLCRIGAVSYSYYLVHQNLSYMIMNFLMKHLGGQILLHNFIAGLCVVPVALAVNSVAQISRNYLLTALKLNHQKEKVS